MTKLFHSAAFVTIFVVDLAVIGFAIALYLP